MKPICNRLDDAAGPRFRWVKPAASLKLFCARRADRRILGFPLGKTGGLIEAASGSVSSALVSTWFPLGKTGGLIEALYRSPFPYLAPCFRWVKPAASLKQPDRVDPLAQLHEVSAG